MSTLPQIKEELEAKFSQTKTSDGRSPLTATATLDKICNADRARANSGKDIQAATIWIISYSLDGVLQPEYTGPIKRHGNGVTSVVDQF